MHGTGRPQCRWVFRGLVTVPKAAATLALHEPRGATSGTKLALLTRNAPFWRVLRVQGELCTAYETTSGTKLPQQAAPVGSPGTKLSQHTEKRRFWGI